MSGPIYPNPKENEMTEAPEVNEVSNETPEEFVDGTAPLLDAEGNEVKITTAMMRKYLKMMRGGKKNRQTKGNVLPHIAKKKRQAQRAARKKNRS